MSRFSKVAALLTAALATWVLMLPVRAGAQNASVLFGSFNGVATPVAVDSSGSMLVTSGSGATLTDPVFKSALPNIDSSSVVPVLCACGAGNVDNGLHRYKFTWTTIEGETAAGSASSGVTVVDKTVNGKVTVPLPVVVGAAQATSLKIYRTVAAGSVYKLLATISDASFATSFTYTDNIADASLGATIPSTNTTSGPRFSIAGDSIVPVVSEYRGGDVLHFGTPGNNLYIQAWDASSPAGPGGSLNLFAGNTYSSVGGDAILQAGSSSKAGSFGGYARIIAGSGGSGTTGNVMLQGLITQVRSLADDAYAYLDALGIKISGAATSGTYLKGNGTAFVQSTNPAQEMSVFTTNSTGNIDDLDFSNASLIRFTGGSTITVRGLKAGVTGQTVTLVAAGAGNVLLSHEDTGDGTAANRLINKIASGKTVLAASGSGTAIYIYDGTTAMWRLVDHQQGAYLIPAFSAGDYTGNASMTWTVDSGDVAVNQYMLVNTTLHWQISVATTTVAGTPNTMLQVAVPGGYTFAGACTQESWLSDNGTRGSGIVFGTSGTSLLSEQLLTPGNWAAATNTTQVVWNIACQVN